MSNLLGDYQFGVNMLGADPDVAPTWDGSYRATILGGTNIDARLYLSPRFHAVVTGGTQVVSHLDPGFSQPHLSAVIVGSTVISGRMQFDTAAHLSATIVGSTQITATPPVPRALVLLGEVGVSVRRGLAVPGSVLASSDISPIHRTTPQEQVVVPVPFYT